MRGPTCSGSTSPSRRLLAPRRAETSALQTQRTALHTMPVRTCSQTMQLLFCQDVHQTHLRCGATCGPCSGVDAGVNLTTSRYTVPAPNGRLGRGARLAGVGIWCVERRYSQAVLAYNPSDPLVSLAQVPHSFCLQLRALDVGQRHGLRGRGPAYPRRRRGRIE